MLATGTSQKHVEIIDLVNPRFQDTLQIKTPSRWGAVGGWIQNKPVIFGGSNGLMSRIKDGFFIRNKSPISKPIKMMEERYGASAVVLNDDTLWIVGGANGTQDLSSSEFVTLKGSTKGPFLPFTVYGHSMVKVNDSTVYLIGGAQDSVTSKKTWILRNPLTKMIIEEGPNLSWARENHGSALMKHSSGKSLLVVAGGVDRRDREFSPTSVEILDVACKTWCQGPGLLYRVSFCQMFTSPTNRSVVLIGGNDAYEYDHTVDNCLWELSEDSRGRLTWFKLDQKLKYPRTKHVAIPVPGNQCDISPLLEFRDYAQELKAHGEL